MEAMQENETDYFGEIYTSPEVNIVNWISSLGIFPVMGIAGLIINSVAIYVLQSQPKKTSTEIILLGLVVADCLSAVVVLLFVIPETMSICSTIVSFEDIPEFFFSDYTYALTFFPLNLSKMMMAAIGLERTFAINKPFTFRQIWRPRNAVGLIIVCIVVAGLVSAIPLLLPGMYTDNWSIGVIYTAMILLTVIICMVASLYGLKQSRKGLSQNSDTGASRHRLAKEQRVTKLILGMTLSFVVCNTLPLVTQINDLIHLDVDTSFVNECSSVEGQIIVTGGLMLEIIYTIVNTFFMILAKHEYKKKLMSVLRPRSTATVSTALGSLN